MDTTNFNGKIHKVVKPKRPSVWYRLASQEEYKYIRSALHQGILPRIVGTIFSIDIATIIKIGVSENYTDYTSKNIKKIIEEGKPDEPIRTNEKRYTVPVTHKPKPHKDGWY